MPTQKKIDLVKTLADKLDKAKSVVLVNPAGLTHKQFELVRKQLKKVDAEFTVAKNTLLKLALSQSKKTFPADHLTGPTAALFAYADDIEPIKILSQFFKNISLGKIKAGILANEFLEADQIQTIANLPPKLELLSQLAATLQAPISGLHYALSWKLNQLVWVLNAIKNQKNLPS